MYQHYVVFGKGENNSTITIEFIMFLFTYLSIYNLCHKKKEKKTTVV